VAVTEADVDEADDGVVAVLDAAKSTTVKIIMWIN